MPRLDSLNDNVHARTYNNKLHGVNDCLSVPLETRCLIDN